MEIIDLRRLARDEHRPATGGSTVASAEIVPAPPSGIVREIKCMLFADVVGYSKLKEHGMPDFIYRFLTTVAARLRETPVQPQMVNTWGDAIFVVMAEGDLLGMAEYAFALQKVVCKTDWSKEGLPKELGVRIALHVGPVYHGKDPIAGRDNFYGSHVNRAARIEPITQPGCVYVSKPFAALLILELLRRHPDGKLPYQIEYVGRLALPKSFGFQTLYQLRRPNEHSPISA